MKGIMIGFGLILLSIILLGIGGPSGEEPIVAGLGVFQTIRALFMRGASKLGTGGKLLIGGSGPVPKGPGIITRTAS